MENIKAGTVRTEQRYLDLINQIFEIEKKTQKIQEDNSIQRNINKLKTLLEEDFFSKDETKQGFLYHNPIGEPYNESRTDCDADIAGKSTENLVIVEVIKPIIFFQSVQNGANFKTIVQKAVVVVESK